MEGGATSLVREERLAVLRKVRARGRREAGESTKAQIRRSMEKVKSGDERKWMGRKEREKKNNQVAFFKSLLGNG